MSTSGGEGRTLPAVSRALGEAAERRAEAHLRAAGLRTVARHYRSGGGPHRRAGEIDLVMWAPDGTLVFVEVRARGSASAGGAAASVGAAKRASLQRAARHYLQALASPPPCRFDVVAVDGDRLEWLLAAFDAGD